MCLFGVVFRGAASPSPPVGGPALKCLKVACRTVECGPSQSTGRLALKQGADSVCAATRRSWFLGCVCWLRMATTSSRNHPPRPNLGACFSIGFISRRSGRCLSRRSNPPYPWRYLNPWNWQNRGTASLYRPKSAKKDRRPLPEKRAEKSPPEGVRSGLTAEPAGLSPSLPRRSGQPLNVGLFFLSLSHVCGWVVRLAEGGKHADCVASLVLYTTTPYA